MFYSTSGSPAATYVPQFTCPTCTTEAIRWYEEMRYKATTSNDIAILQIYNVQPTDYGIYRCAATAKTETGELETLYQIVDFKPKHFN